MNDSFFTFSDFELTDFDSAFDSRDSNSFSLDVEGDSSSDINGTEGEDYIENIRDDVAINAKGGNDTVNNSGSQVIILGGYGNDEIFNSGSKSLILGDDDDDYISNTADNVSINGGSENDRIESNGNNVLISGGDDDDYINNSGTNVSINGGEGNDYIDNSGSNVSINGGAGDDTIYNYGGANNVTISGGEGNDYIDNYNGTNNVTIDGGAGDDTIYNNDGANVTISGGAGKDEIRNGSNNVTIAGGAGNDEIGNHGNNSIIDGGAGKDDVWNYGTNVTIAGGAGNDKLYNSGTGLVYTYKSGDGNDYISGFGFLDTLVVEGADYTTTIKDSDIIVTVGKNKITLAGAANLLEFNIVSSTESITPVNIINNTTANLSVKGKSTSNRISNTGENVKITGGKVNDYIDNNADYVTINGGAGKDYIFNNGDNVSINGGSGNDSINNHGNEVKIEGGAGDDYIFNENTGGYSTLNGSDGNDTIYNGFYAGAANDVLINAGKDNDYIYNNGGFYITIDGGAGEDTIENNVGDNVTIDGGAGNDYINNNSGENVLIKYSEGDGNDVIDGFNETSTLSIGDGTGTYSTEIDGDDIIVTVGDGSITLRGAAYLETVNIDGEEIFLKPEWRLNGTTAAYGTPKETLITISGVKSLDGLSEPDENNVITVSAAAVETDGTPLKLLTEGYTLALAEEMPKSETVKKSYNAETMIYQTAGKTTGYTNDGKIITYVEGTSVEIEFEGVAGTAKVSSFAVSGDVVTVGKTAVRTDGTSIRLLNQPDYTLKLGKSMEESQTFSKATYNAETMTYNTKGETTGYKLGSDGRSITYVEGTSIKFEFEGVADTAKSTSFFVKEDESKLRVGKTAVNTDGTELKLLSDNGYTLELGNGMPESRTFSKATYDAETMTYNTKGKTTGYTNDGKTITYVEGTSKTFEFEGVAESATAASFFVSGNVVTVGKTAVSTDGTELKILTDGYTLKLGKGMEESQTFSKATYNRETMTYRTAGETTGYAFSDGKRAITYIEGTSVEIEFEGVADTAKNTSFLVSDNVVTVGKTAVSTDGTELKILTDGYTLKLGKGMNPPSTKPEGWYLDGTTANYNTASATEGYTLAEDQRVVTYSAAVEGTTLAAIEGVKSLDGITTNDNTVKVTKAAALSKNVSVSSSNYGFEFASGYEQALINGTAYDDTIKTAGRYITINSGKGDDSIVSSGKNASVNAGAGDNYVSLGSKASNSTVVTGSGSDVISNKSASALINTKGGHDSIVSTGANTTIDSGTGNDTITNSGANVSINAGDGNDVIENSGGNVTISGGAGNDSITGGKGADTLVGGKGNDTLTGGAGADVFVYNAGDGDDVISDYSQEDTIQIVGETVAKVTKKSGNIILTLAGKNKITVTGGADKLVTYFDEDGEHTYPEVVKFNAKGTAATLTADYNKDTFDIADYEEYRDSVLTIDASAVTQDLSIVANKKNNTILGSDGNDSINGGKGNDSIVGGAGADSLFGGEGADTLDGGAGNDTLTGGAGADVFVYNGGNDLISDYAEDDTIKIVGDTVAKTTKKSGNVIFTLASKKKITVTGGADKVIAYTDDSGEHTYPEVVKFNTKGTAATLTADYNKDEFDIANYSDYAKTVVTINASAVDQAISITANQKNNKIIGGAGNDSIDGGDGNDSIEGGIGNDVLTGGEGADVFIYNAGDGNDVIADYEDDDTIKIVGDTVAKTTKKNDNIIFTLASKKKITVTGGADKVIAYTDDSGDHTYPEVVKFNAKGTAATLTADYNKDTFDIANYSDYAKTVVTINASAVDQAISITANQKNNKIIGGAGNDSIDGGDGNDSIEGGIGNDVLTGGEGADVFIYNAGDGNDVIADYEDDDTIKIVGDTVAKTTKKNDNIIFTLASKKKITVTGGADKVIAYTDDSGDHTYPEIVKFNSKGTAATLTADYNKDTFDIADYPDYAKTVVTIDASAVDQAISITANQKNNKIIGGAGNDSIDGGDGNDSIEGGIGNDVLTGGEGADVFIYNAGDGNDVIADYEDDDTIKIVGDTVAKTTKKNDNIIFTLASKKKITVTGGADKVIAYTDDSGDHTYPEIVKFNTKGTAATLTTDYNKDTFNIADYEDYATTVVTIDASAVDQDLTIIANQKNNKILGSEGNDVIDGGTGNDSIVGGIGADSLFGGAGADTLDGGDGNDTLTGGAGADLFVYNGGNDLISDYEDDDTIQIVGDTVAKTTKKSGNVIFTLASKKKITVTGGADKVIAYTDDSGDHTYPEIVKFNTKGTAATLTADYNSDEFNIGDYEDYATTVVTIDASAVTHGITITGNKKNNVITGGESNDTILGGTGNDKLYGGKGNDSLWGGAGTDTLVGGEGNDIFVYDGDAKNKLVIDDFQAGDILRVLSGDIYSESTDSKGNVTFKFVEGGSIVLNGASDKFIKPVNASGSAYIVRHEP